MADASASEASCTTTGISTATLYSVDVDSYRHGPGAVLNSAQDSVGGMVMAKSKAKAKTKGKAKAKKRSAAKREQIAPRGDKRYARGSAGGEFKESDVEGRSLSMGRRSKAKTKAKRGQGDRGD